MFTFSGVLHDAKAKKHKQTLESAQYGLEIRFKTTAVFECTNEQSVFVVFLCFTSENYTKTIIRSRLAEHWQLFTSTSPRLTKFPSLVLIRLVLTEM